MDMVSVTAVIVIMIVTIIIATRVLLKSKHKFQYTAITTSLQNPNLKFKKPRKEESQRKPIQVTAMKLETPLPNEKQGK